MRFLNADKESYTLPYLLVLIILYFLNQVDTDIKGMLGFDPHMGVLLLLPYGLKGHLHV